MSNTITIELCAEDRARLDRLAAALEARNCDSCVTSALKLVQASRGQDEVQQRLAETLAKAETPAAAPQEAAEEAEAPTPTATQPEEEQPTAAEDVAAAPPVTLEQIQQKVVQLAAGFGGSKKAEVRKIINAYGAKVSDLKDQPDKWPEVWGKLLALESET
jgi:hypothetical protein